VLEPELGVEVAVFEMNVRAADLISLVSRDEDLLVRKV
jgi:hypothetical protein